MVTSDNGTQIGAIKYYPYGECGFSQGTLGTDRLFTGQRLDDTGLYYYGARYYDPTIGRFISADAIAQNPANPQTLNRYSYVSNNPLKYTGPTGMYFSVTYPWSQGTNYDWLSYDAFVDPVETAYLDIMIDPGVPEWIKGYMEKIHNSERPVYVGFDDLGGEAVGVSAMQISRYGINVGTTPDLMILDYTSLGQLTPTLTHESYHIFEGNPGASIAEEYAAYTAQHFVEQALGNQNAFPGYWFSTPGGLGSQEFLGGIQAQLEKGKGNSANVYSSMPLTQSGMNRRYLVAQGATAMGTSTSCAAAFGYLSYLIGPLSVTGIPWK